MNRTSHSFRSAARGGRVTLAVLAILVAGCEDSSTRTATLSVGQRRVVPLEESDEITVSPKESCEVARLCGCLAVIIPLEVGDCVISIHRPHFTRSYNVSVTPPEQWSTAAAELPPPRARPLPVPEESQPSATPAPTTVPAPARAIRPLPAVPPPTFPRLLGTAAEEGGARAMFAEKDAREGERIGPFRLEQILEDGVRLLWNGRHFYVPISGAAREELEVNAAAESAPLVEPRPAFVPAVVAPLRSSLVLTARPPPQIPDLVGERLPPGPEKLEGEPQPLPRPPNLEENPESAAGAATTDN